ncbi:uncharacterized protein EDB93DRAFT_1248609 [Suillus bovinus]|uniref:uncharacterized protein n=1 Tax=Suillus bovinus TaxID=48563 RepID=UPI001B88308C|nr:uncharacterized protein EDB93DRAFT_1248609 [Suillus bovinus]KAG2153705.1 hypothetical protein EDB93DRAFT_1248609 [Suillus bovinus]
MERLVQRQFWMIFIIALPFAGLRRFPQGCGFSQWTGDDSKALMKVYLSAIEEHVPQDIIRCFWAFLKFCYIVRQDIITEDTLVQLSDCLEHFHRYQQIFQDTGIRFDGFSLPHQHALCHYSMLICLFGVPNGICSSITESKHIKAVKEPMFPSVHVQASFYAPSDPSGVGGMQCEYIRAAPSWRQGPTHNNTVFVNTASKDGINGMEVCCVLCFFSFQHSQKTFPYALVHWFKLLQEHLDAWAPTIFLLILLVSALTSHPYPDLTLVILVILAFPFALYLSLQQSQYIWPDPFADEAYPCSVPPPD